MEEGSCSSSVFSAKNLQAETERTKLTRSAKRGVWQMASSQAAYQVLAWGLTLATMRYLTPSEYGVMALAETLVPYLILISTCDMLTWLIQERNPDEKAQRVVLLLSISTGVLACMGAVAAAPFAAVFFESPALSSALRLMATAFIARGLSIVPEAMLQRELRFAPLALMNVCVGLASSIIQLLLAIFGFGYWALVIGFVCREWGRLIWLVGAHGFPGMPVWDRQLACKVLGFGLPSAGAAFLWVIYNTSDNIIVGRLFDLSVMGQYTMAFYLIDLPLAKLNMMAKPVFLPFFSRLKDDRRAFEKALLSTTSGVCAICVPLIAGLGLVAHELVFVVLGRQWEGMIVPLQAMSVVGVLRVLGNNIHPFFLAAGKPRLVFVCNLLGVAMLPCLVLLGALQFGLPGVFAAWLVFVPCLISINLFLLRQISHIKPAEFLRAVFPSVFAALIMAGVVSLVVPTVFMGVAEWMLLAAKISIGALSYVAVLRLCVGASLTRLLFSLGMELVDETSEDFEKL